MLSIASGAAGGYVPRRCLFDRSSHHLVKRCVVAARLLAWVVAVSLGSTAAMALDYSEAIRELDRAAAEIIQAGELSGVSIALVDDQQLVYANGFGWADKRRRTPATAETVYRAGSISKLFTALAVVQLAEKHQLDLDQPVINYVPAFAGVVNPFPATGPVTLRQLMCHRSGLIRESPVGSYFDDSEPNTAETVDSLAGCVLVYPPGTKTKYSNSGVAVVGQAVALAAQVPFEEYQRIHLLQPMAMDSSDFVLNRQLRGRLARGYLPVAQVSGCFKEIEAPLFKFGMLPAANLYTTAPNLGRFLSCLFAQTRTQLGPLIRAEALEQMLTPQLTTNVTGYGLGFSIGEFQGQKTFNHSGAVYGFTSMLTGLPGPKLGVVVLCNDDLATGPVRRLSQRAMELLLQAKTGQAPAQAKPTHAITPADLVTFAGDYECESYWAKVEAGDGLLLANISGQQLKLRPVGARQFEGSGRIAHASPVEFRQDGAGKIAGFTALGRSFERVNPGLVPPVPDHWRKLLGQYGPSFIPVIITIKHGHLYAMIENEFDNRLSPVTQMMFKMPLGLYTDEYLAFERDSRGRVRGLTLANMHLRRGRR
jgi:CubicO group peptidase (beta-lactamase class C family)